jgi:hypothetical protein
MRQIWNFLDVAAKKLRRALEDSLTMLSKHQSLKDCDGEGLPERYSTVS